MGKNKKGFTLVELLAVIVILGLLIVLVTPAVLSVLNNSKKQAFFMYAQSLESKALSKYMDDDTQEKNEGKACYAYDIKTDLDLKNTGSYDGWVKVEKIAVGNGDKVVTVNLSNNKDPLRYVNYCITDSVSKDCEPNKSYSFEEGDTTVEITKSLPIGYTLCATSQFVSNGKLVYGSKECSTANESSPSVENTYEYRVAMVVTNETYDYNGEFNKDNTTLELFKKTLVEHNASNGISIIDCEGNEIKKIEDNTKTCAALSEDKKHFNIKFDANGGYITDDNNAYSIFNKDQCVSCSDSVSLYTPTRDKDEFLGWYTDKSFSDDSKVKVATTGKITPIQEKNAAGCIIGYKDITLYAKWKNAATTAKETKTTSSTSKSNKTQRTCETLSSDKYNFTITLDANGGEIGNESKVLLTQCSNCSSYHTLQDPTRNKDKFLGWYFDKSFNKKLSTADTSGVDVVALKDSRGCLIGYKNVTLYAKWESEVTTKATKGTVTVKITNAQGKTCAAMSEDKYNFNITFDANGGTVNKTSKLILNQCAGNDCTDYYSLPVPVKGDKDEFLGWYYDKAFTKKLINGDTRNVTQTLVTDASGCPTGYKNVVLYAKWNDYVATTESKGDKTETTTTTINKSCKTLPSTINSFTITFEGNGGLVENKTSHQVKQCTDCGTYTELPIPVKENDEFMGWYLDKGFNDKLETNDTSGVSKSYTLDSAGCPTGYKNITLYARWKTSVVVTTERGTSTVGTTEVASVEEVFVSTTTVNTKDESLLLNSLNLAGYNIGFNKLKFYYSIDVPYTTDKLTVNATPANASTQVELSGNNSLGVGTNVIVAHLTNEAGLTSNYTVVVNRYNERGEKVTNKVTTTNGYGVGEGLPDPLIEASDASLRAVHISGYTFDFKSDVYFYDFAIREPGPISLEAVPNNKDAVVFVSNTSNLKKGDTVTITVTSANGYYRKTYVINIKEIEEVTTQTKVLRIVAITLAAVLSGSLIILSLLKSGKLTFKRKEKDVDGPGPSSGPEA